jgi:16S rRNA (guanine527-N7)-methyltransferase
MNDEKTRITNWFSINKLAITQEQTDQFVQYLEMIFETSKKMNLVSKNDLPSLVERHLLDSLGALTSFEFLPGTHIADLGSGAGFPGIPLAIARPDIKIDLIESRRLKCLFLKSVVESLELENVDVIHDRWENLKTTYDIILARAVYSETELKRIALPRLNETGVLLYFARYNDIRIIARA